MFQSQRPPPSLRSGSLGRLSISHLAAPLKMLIVHHATKAPTPLRSGCVTTEAICFLSLSLAEPKIKTRIIRPPENVITAAPRSLNYGCSHRVTACRWTRSAFESSRSWFVCSDNNHGLNHTRRINISLSTCCPGRFVRAPASAPQNKKKKRLRRFGAERLL